MKRRVMMSGADGESTVGGGRWAPVGVCTLLLVVATACQSSPPPVETSSPDQAAANANAAPQPPSTTPSEIEPYPKTIDGRLVLALLPVGSDRSINYEVSIAQCVGNECPIEISLVEGSVIVDRTSTEWAASTREPVTEDVEQGWGAGDPVAAPPDLVAWATGEEERYVGTAVRPVRLASNLTGVLVDQRSGFEHVKRHHALFIGTGRRIERVWNVGEGAGPEWTSVAIVPASNGLEAMVLFRGFRYPASDRADSLSATILSWDPAEGRLVERADGAQIHASIIGGFASVGATRKAKSADTDCLGPFWVLPNARFVDRQAPGFVLALPSVSADQARAAAACAETRKPVVVRMY